MAAAAADEPLSQAFGERLDAKCIEPDQRNITERSRQLARIFELLFRRGRHGSAGIEQHAHGHARLDLKHLEEELLEPHIRPPVDGAKIVAAMEMAMIEKLL